MQKHKFVEILVGIFLLLGVTALIILAFQVSGIKEFKFHKAPFRVLARFDNIGGLNIQARVTVAGVTVGRIAQINLDTSEHSGYQALVIMELLPEIGNLLPKDSSASIKTNGLLGNNYIAINPGDAAKILHSGDEIEETHSALVLEDMIGQLIFNLGKNDAK